MAEPIGPGDMVERIRDGRCFDMPFGAVREVKGIIDRLPGAAVAGWICRTCGPHPLALALVGEKGGWCPAHWRPVSRRADFETILAQLKTPVPMPEHETA